MIKPRFLGFHLRHSTQALGFAKWGRAAKARGRHRRAMHTAMGRVISRWTRRRLALAFDSWLEQLMAAKRLDALFTRVYDKVQWHNCARAFASLRAHAHSRITAKALLSKVQPFTLNSTL